LFIFVSFTIGLLSCKKDTTQNNVTNTQVEKIVKLEKGVFAKNINPNKIHLIEDFYKIKYIY